MLQPTSEWKLKLGHYPVLAGRLEVGDCGPHLHDTYTLALMKEGSSVIKMREQTCGWTTRSIFLGNPYEVHEGVTERSIRYEVLYPSLDLMRAGLGLSTGDARVPYFSRAVAADPHTVDELTLVLSSCLDQGGMRGGAAAEEQFIRFMREYASSLGVRLAKPRDCTPVHAACRIMQETLDTNVDLSELAGQVGYSRYYFIRLFHKVTGVPPNVYLRQLRLSRARQLICSGYAPAQAASACGFSDQAHLTREFKRSFCTTPGKVARDLFRSAAAHPVE
jgi:AraC-like DNA-binding protein